jgi:hypothetical protein
LNLIDKKKLKILQQRKAGWDSWLFRIANTDEVAGSNPALVILLFAFFTLPTLPTAST